MPSWYSLISRHSLAPWIMLASTAGPWHRPRSQLNHTGEQSWQTIIYCSNRIYSKHHLHLKTICATQKKKRLSIVCAGCLFAIENSVSTAAFDTPNVVTSDFSENFSRQTQNSKQNRTCRPMHLLAKVKYLSSILKCIRKVICVWCWWKCRHNSLSDVAYRADIVGGRREWSGSFLSLTKRWEIRFNRLN